MNNAVYHAIFDTVINVYLIRHVGLDVASSESPIGYMLKGNCTFLGSAKYPDIYLAGLGIQKIGNTSLTYKLALFNPIKESDDIYMNIVSDKIMNNQLKEKFADSGIVLGD